MLRKRPKNPINIGISSVKRLTLYPLSICGFYVTRFEKSAVGAEKAGFALFF